MDRGVQTVKIVNCALPSMPNPEKIVHIPKVISRELFDTDIQQRKFMDNMKLLNKEQSDIFDKVTENVNL